MPGEELCAATCGRSSLTPGYNCLCVRTPDGLALLDTGSGRRFRGYGPQIEPLVGRARRSAAAGC